MLKPIITSTDKSLAAQVFPCAVFFFFFLLQASREALFYSCLCQCRAFKLFSLIWRGICRKSQNPSLSRLIVDVFVCVVCLWRQKKKKEGGGLERVPNAAGCSRARQDKRSRSTGKTDRHNTNIWRKQTTQAHARRRPCRKWRKHPGHRWHLIHPSHLSQKADVKDA